MHICKLCGNLHAVHTGIVCAIGKSDQNCSTIAGPMLPTAGAGMEQESEDTRETICFEVPLKQILEHDKLRYQLLYNDAMKCRKIRKDCERLFNDAITSYEPPRCVLMRPSLIGVVLLWVSNQKCRL